MTDKHASIADRRLFDALTQLANEAHAKWQASSVHTRRIHYGNLSDALAMIAMDDETRARLVLLMDLAP